MLLASNLQYKLELLHNVAPCTRMSLNNEQLQFKMYPEQRAQNADASSIKALLLLFAICITNCLYNME